MAEENQMNAATIEYPTVLYDTPQAGVARITMNRPQARNAQNLQMTYDINEAMDRAAQDDAIKVIILAGADPHFSSGHDLRADPAKVLGRDFKPVETWGGFAQEGSEGRYAREQEIYLGLTRRWRNLSKPTIAQVQGKCFAGGLMLAWACDLIIASDDASFRDPGVEMGNVGMEWFAHPWELGPRKAKELLFTADEWTAQEAMALGMVNRIFPRDSLAAEVLSMASRIALKPAFALKLAKQAVNRSVDIMGQQNAIDQAFQLHQLAHAHNMLKFGMLMDPSGVPAAVKGKPAKA